MSRVCLLSGKRPQYGHNVSHSNRKTKRRFLPNLQPHRIWVESEKRFVRLRITSYGLRLIDKFGFEKALAKSKRSLSRG
jgi:large subunit ribosomal protein L28